MSPPCTPPQALTSGDPLDENSFEANGRVGSRRGGWQASLLALPTACPTTADRRHPSPTHLHCPVLPTPAPQVAPRSSVVWGVAQRFELQLAPWSVNVLRLQLAPAPSK